MDGDADADLASLWSVELDAVVSTFGSSVTVHRERPPRVAFACAPTRAATPFVGVTLVADCGPAYPGAPPDLALTDVRGLGDGRRAALLADLRAAAAAAAGDFSLALLADAAADALAAAPAPDGECPLCLDPLADGPADGAADTLVRLACWHALHARCAGAWWAASGGGARGGDGAAVTCPTCRDVAGPLPPAAMAKLDALATAARGDAAAAAADDALRRGGPAAWGLDAAATAALQGHRAAVARGLAKQADAGGATDDRVAVTLDQVAAALAAARVGGGGEEGGGGGVREDGGGGGGREDGGGGGQDDGGGGGQGGAHPSGSGRGGPAAAAAGDPAGKGGRGRRRGGGRGHQRGGRGARERR